MGGAGPLVDGSGSRLRPLGHCLHRVPAVAAGLLCDGWRPLDRTWKLQLPVGCVHEPGRAVEGRGLQVGAVISNVVSFMYVQPSLKLPPSYIPRPPLYYQEPGIHGRFTMAAPATSNIAPYTETRTRHPHLPAYTYTC
jgi:hypothetical protein